MLAHVLGFPRIGENRELKKALEAHWRGETSFQDLETAAAAIREANWKLQADQSLNLIPVGDFSLYDHVLDTIAMVGAAPERYDAPGADMDADTYFRMARGDAEAGVSAMEMTKWFDTNYHYIVPELSARTAYRRSCSRLVRDVRRARELGHAPKPVLVGPITFLLLGKEAEGVDRWSHLPALTRVYAETVAELSGLCSWIQLDEPMLCCDLPPEARKAFPQAYAELREAAGEAQLLLTTYFGPLGDNLKLALSLPCHGIHIDLCRGGNQLQQVLDALPEDRTLSLGLVDGRNIWKTDLNRALAQLETERARIGDDRLMAASACSLLHCPVNLDSETALPPEQCIGIISRGRGTQFDPHVVDVFLEHKEGINGIRRKWRG